MNVIDFIVLFGLLATLNVNSIFPCSNWTVGMNKKTQPKFHWQHAQCNGMYWAFHGTTGCNTFEFCKIQIYLLSAFFHICVLCSMRFCPTVGCDFFGENFRFNSSSDRSEFGRRQRPTKRISSFVPTTTKWACTFLSLTLALPPAHCAHCCWIENVEFGSLFWMFSFQITF